MSIINNGDVINGKIVWIKQLFFHIYLFLSSGEASIIIESNYLPLSVWIINSVTTSITLINTDSKWMKRVSWEFLLTIVGLAWHGWLFRDTYFIGCS